MSSPQEAIIYARRLCYLGCVDKIERYMKWDGYRLTRDTIERELHNYRRRQQENRSFRPEPGRNHYNDELAGNIDMDKAETATAILGWAVQQYQERCA